MCRPCLCSNKIALASGSASYLSLCSSSAPSGLLATCCLTSIPTLQHKVMQACSFKEPRKAPKPELDRNFHCQKVKKARVLCNILWCQQVLVSSAVFWTASTQYIVCCAVSNTEHKSYTESTLCSELYKDVQDVWQAAHGKCSGYGHRLRTKSTSENITGNAMLQIQLPGLFMQALDSKGCFQDLYFFHLQETKFPEFLLLNWYTSTCPLASHLNNVVVAMQTPEGRRTYDGKEFKNFQGTTLSWSRHPESEDEVYLRLKQLFNLKLDAA